MTSTWSRRRWTTGVVLAVLALIAAALAWRHCATEGPRAPEPLLGTKERVARSPLPSACFDVLGRSGWDVNSDKNYISCHLSFTESGGDFVTFDLLEGDPAGTVTLVRVSTPGGLERLEQIFDDIVAEFVSVGARDRLRASIRELLEDSSSECSELDRSERLFQDRVSASASLELAAVRDDQGNRRVGCRMAVWWRLEVDLEYEEMLRRKATGEAGPPQDAAYAPATY